ncbi:HAD-IA family hydrolase [Albirhodobacter sp. R86504]|jgi:phosphoglycolate phosphatase|uniref:HAD-IA family hydrolase n=1 Tax=Albirhodobacter sp. R86504 TaxID=3093848 RepID=UPI003671F94C
MRLAIFDVDGTISDSQANILEAMRFAFGQEGLVPPPRDEILSIVGLSLPEAVARLVPDVDPARRAVIVDGYKASFMQARIAHPAPLYAGAEALLRRLAARDDILLAVATGKSRRGLRALIEHHRLEKIFVSLQVADDHPSKPSPSMVLAALSETGCAAERAVMIGDTSFDMEMGAAAGVSTIGVSWGYHPVADLERAGAGLIVDDFEALERSIDAQLGAV